MAVAARHAPDVTADAAQRHALSGRDAAVNAPGEVATTAGAAVATFAGLVGSAALTGALTLALIHLLPKAEYGAFALGVGVIQIVVLLGDLGITLSTSRRLAVLSQDADLRRRAAAGGLLLRAAGIACACGALAAFAPLIARWLGNGDLAGLLRLAAAAAAGQSLLQFCRISLISLRAPGAMLTAILVEGVLEIIASICLVLVSANAVAAMSGRAAAFAVGGLLALALLVRTTGGLRRPAAGETRAIAAAGLPVAVADLSWVLLLQIDVLLIGVFLTRSDVATFEAPMRVLLFGGYVGYALGLAIGPRLAGHATRSGAAKHLRLGLRLAATLQGVAVVVWTVLVAPSAPALFGASYASSTDVMVGLAPYLYLSGTLPLLSLALVYTGRGGARAAVYAAALLLNLAIDIALLRPLGVMGAVVGSNVALAVLVALQLGLIGRLPELRTWAMARPIVVCGLAAAACCSAVLAVPDPGLPGRALLTATGIAGFLALSRVGGAWGGDDVARVTTAARRLTSGWRATR